MKDEGLHQITLISDNTDRLIFSRWKNCKLQMTFKIN